jgi:hypothetical protein
LAFALKSLTCALLVVERTLLSECEGLTPRRMRQPSIREAPSPNLTSPKSFVKERDSRINEAWFRAMGDAARSGLLIEFLRREYARN